MSPDRVFYTNPNISEELKSRLLQWKDVKVKGNYPVEVVNGNKIFYGFVLIGSKYGSGSLYAPMGTSALAGKYESKQKNNHFTASLMGLNIGSLKIETTSGKSEKELIQLLGLNPKKLNDRKKENIFGAVVASLVFKEVTISRKLESCYGDHNLKTSDEPGLVREKLIEGFTQKLSTELGLVINPFQIPKDKPDETSQFPEFDIYN